MVVATYTMLSPFCTLFFLPLLGVQTAGIILSMGAVLFLIIPLGKGIYGNIGDQVRGNCEQGVPYFEIQFTVPPSQSDLCEVLVEWAYWTWPPVILMLTGLAVAIVSFIMEGRNRTAYCTKRALQVRLTHLCYSLLHLSLSFHTHFL